MSTMAASVPDVTRWQPVAHVAVRDQRLRTILADTLHSCGWATIDSPSGYHLLQHLSGPILGEQQWLRPDLIVVDAFSPGCSGLTIARGLRDLGWSTPVVLVAACEEHEALAAETSDAQICVVRRENAASIIDVVTRHFTRTYRQPDRHASDPIADPRYERRCLKLYRDLEPRQSGRP